MHFLHTKNFVKLHNKKKTVNKGALEHQKNMHGRQVKYIQVHVAKINF